MTRFRKGTRVEWAWGRGFASGHITEVFTESVTCTIKGKKITRHGTKDKPAYLIEQAGGNRVLKSHSELHVEEKRHGWA